jgi:hypothetical protein
MTFLRYAAPAMGLVACPFCRELFERGEVAQCPICGLALTALEKLPLSHDASMLDGGTVTAADQLVQPWLYAKRGRMPLALCGIAGIAAFFLPWVSMSLPYEHSFNGLELAQRMGWSWAALAAWMVLVPTVFSRRTIYAMRRARVAAAFLASMPAVTCAVLLAKPPEGRMFTIHFEYAPFFWLTLVATITALRFGGAATDATVITSADAKAATAPGDSV